MPFDIKLNGELGYPDAASASAARASMLAGREGNPALEASRIDGTALHLSFAGELSFANASARVDEIEFGVAEALEAAITGSVTYEGEGGYRRVRHALGREFWAKRWREKQIGFHEGAPNELLTHHVERVEATKEGRPLRVLVPLAGKTVDMSWLAERGHEVVGIEAVWEAVRAFFDEQELDPPVTELGPYRALRHGNVTLACGDFFAASENQVHLGRFDVVYDRAALVALEPTLRARYRDTCKSLLADDGVTFLVTFAYDQKLTHGPPWSVDEAAVRALFAGRAIERLETRTIPPTKRLADAGLTVIEEAAFLIA